MVDNRPNAAVPRPWIAPLISTVITLPASLLALFFGGLTPMACDACNGVEAERFDQSFEIAFTVLQIGLALSFVLLLVSWCLLWNEQNAIRRGAFAALAPCTVLVAVVFFLGLIDGPN
ncbi:hypothetical protein ACFV80_24330 [Streptomyces sp. NPDC059862]|uniref:hypothetical protein n=1 Tax=Streptomyces sp. NPDC059862 TaxID=3346975 RepID=UPI00364FAFE3